MWEYVQKYEKIVTETQYFDENICGCYSSGDGETTFRMPNYAGYKFTGFDEATHTLGKPLDPALPNITGTWAGGRNGSEGDSGCVYSGNAFATYSGGGYWMATKYINASRSSSIYKDGINTVQTPDIPQNIVIKYKS